jgi:hypothetical protein
MKQYSAFRCRCVSCRCPHALPPPLLLLLLLHVALYRDTYIHIMEQYSLAAWLCRISCTFSDPDTPLLVLLLYVFLYCRDTYVQ